MFMYSKSSLPAWVINHSSWPDLVRDALESLRAHFESETPMQRLSLFKKAMMQSCKEVKRLYSHRKAGSCEEKLSCAFNLLRAAVKGDSQQVVVNLRRYPFLEQLVNFDALNRGNFSTLEAVQCPAHSGGTVPGINGTGGLSGCIVHAGWSGQVVALHGSPYFTATLEACWEFALVEDLHHDCVV